MSELRMSTTAEPTLQASKWQKCQVLLDDVEMASLFESLGDISLYLCGGVLQKGQERFPLKAFLGKYHTYIHQLKSGTVPDINEYRPFFSAFMTTTPDALFAIPVETDKLLVRVSKPIVQVQLLNFHYSDIDNTFHGGVFGKDSIVWGLQFSYPQLYQDAVTKQVDMVRNSSKFPNSLLFNKLQKWMRQNSIPTPFIVNGTIVNVPLRIGKNCLSWINSHPQLIKESLSVETKVTPDESDK
jgi:hypothetical protein